MSLRTPFAALTAAGALVISGLSTAAIADSPTLRDAAGERPLIGTAVWGERDLLGDNPTKYADFLGAEFSSLTPENDMKWESIHPEADRYDFTGADAVMEFAESHGQGVRGHTLLWHSQNPQWVNDASPNWTCDDAREVLKDHIDTVVGRYKGRVYEWDVANELIQDDWDEGGIQLRTRTNPFLRACSQDPVALIGDAFRWAHAADPEAILFLNDYNAEGINEKTDAYYELAKELLADGVPLHGFGAQAHLSLQYGFDNSLAANMQRFADLGLKVAITEADVRVPMEGRGVPTEEQIAEHARRHTALLQACIDQPACTSFTLWGFNDAYSWVPDTFPGEDWANVMDADGKLKPAYYDMLAALRGSGSVVDDADDGQETSGDETEGDVAETSSTAEASDGRPVQQEIKLPNTGV